MKNTWIWIVVIVIAAVGAFLLFQNMQKASISEKTPTEITQENTTPTPVDTATASTSGTSTTAGSLPAPITITFSDKGFSLASVTVAKGTTVTFVNESKSKMNVASGSHPGHEGYDGTSRSAHCATGYSGEVPFDQCTPGTSYSFTFTKAGSWPYHNHFNAGQYGTVVVTE